MTSKKLASLFPKLLQRVGLVRTPAVHSVIHEKAKYTALGIAGFWDLPASPSATWSTLLIKEACSLEEDTSRGLCALLYRIYEGKVPFQVLYGRKEFILSHINNFTVDEVLLLCGTLARHVQPYAKWFNVNHDDLTVLLMACHRRVLSLVPKMSPDQFQSCLVIFELLRSRYAIFSIDDGIIRQTLTRLQNELAQFEGPSLGASRIPPKNEVYEKEASKLPSRVQLVYERVYPYYETVETRVCRGRGYISCLIEAAAVIQSCTAGSLPMDQYSTLCLVLKRHMPEDHLFSLVNTLKTVILLRRNHVFSLDDGIQLDTNEINILATRLQELVVDSYLVLPDHEGEFQLPDLVEQCATRLFGICLECPCLVTLLQSMTALHEADFLNEHMIILYLPYISSCLQKRDYCVHDLLELIPLALTPGIGLLPFWMVHLSLLERCDTLKHEILPKMHQLLSTCIGRLSADLFGAVSADIQQHDANDYREESTPPLSAPLADGVSSPQLLPPRQWVWVLGDVRFVNITDMDGMEASLPLSELVNKRFKTGSPSGMMHDFLRTLNRIYSRLGETLHVPPVNSAKVSSVTGTCMESQNTLQEENFGIKMHNCPVAPPTELVRAHELLGLRIAIFERQINNIL
ncbi:flxA, putative [Babesia ovis]|uniref:FlxA, putative n=1 Tax=Babesia ovis TaxID=5869 RepID=A0A9W5T9E3_BABOV|nr:flxA, putative [Babesia ovis]